MSHNPLLDMFDDLPESDGVDEFRTALIDHAVEDAVERQRLALRAVVEAAERWRDVPGRVVARPHHANEALIKAVDAYRAALRGEV